MINDQEVLVTALGLYLQVLHYGEYTDQSILYQDEI